MSITSMIGSTDQGRSNAEAAERLACHCATEADLGLGEFLAIAVEADGECVYVKCSRDMAAALLELRGHGRAMQTFDSMPADGSGVIISLPGRVYCIWLRPMDSLTSAPGGEA